ncbi:MAG: ABC-F family ATP-binding cassette domain-containing protein [Bacteroidetes bacterium]|nr:ABC-F family ATP-binding cassette domain-containing protein [Bacteroidota bacterium]
MLSLEHITLEFGERTLFRDISATIGPRDRIGLVGSNGSGKTTLLRIISGFSQGEEGSINKAHYVTVGYLQQETIALHGKTLYEEAETAFEDIISAQQKLSEAQDSLAGLDPKSDEYTEILEVCGELQHKLEDLDAYRMRSKIERILNGLGFSQKDLYRLTEEFSGGWQMRIAMAKLLLQEPNLLLLDEPTNHLDLESLQWLEEYLRQYNGAIILVSHDRAFLDNLTARTFALSAGRFEEYAGNYSFYEKERLVRRELLLSQQRNQQEQIKHTREFIDRFRYKATKARQVQSRVKMLEKMEIVEVEKEEEELRFRFPNPVMSGRVVMDLQEIHKSYDSLQVFSNLDFKVERGDRIAVVGVNGAGKSTLVRIISGEESFEKGERIIGHNVLLSYFGQDQADELDLTKDILQTVEEFASNETRTQLRTLLGSFLFHGDDVFKHVSVLSGGEKSRLALARMLLRPANFLIMDEPTNHLDMRSKKVLQNALEEYEGTFLIVSHDRAFLEPVINKVLELSPGSMRLYLGTMSDYFTKKKQESTILQDAYNIKQAESLKSAAHTARQEEQERKRAREKEIRALKKQLETVEAEIGLCEQKKTEIETLLADPELYKRGDEAKTVSADYKSIRKQLEDAYWRWGNISEQLEKIQL